MTKTDRLLLHLIGKCPWISAAEILDWIVIVLARGDRRPKSISTVNRSLAKLKEKGLVASLTLGRRSRPVPRHILSSLGVRGQYPEPFQRGIGVPADHTHSTVWPGEEDHEHVPWQMTRDGAELLLHRLEQLEVYYAVLPGLFLEGGAGNEWRGNIELGSPTDFTILRRGRLLEATLSFQSQYTFHVCWMGKSQECNYIREKWLARTADLETRTLQENLARIVNSRQGLPLPDPANFPEPVPSAHIVLTPDWWLQDQAIKALTHGDGKEEDSFLFLNVKETDVVDHRAFGRLESSLDRIADKFERFVVGRPQLVARGEDEDEQPALAVVLNGVTTHRIIDLVLEFSGMRARHLNLLCPYTAEPMDQILLRLVNREVLQDRQGMYYLGPAGMIYVAHRDRTSLRELQARVASEIKADHVRVGARLRHTDGVNDIVVALKLAGVTVHAGRLLVINIPDATQLDPDIFMEVEFQGQRNVVCIEYERSAIFEGDIVEKLEPWMTAMDHDLAYVVAFVCETQPAEEIFSSLTGDLLLITTTLEDVKRGPVTGERTIWRYTGHPIPIGA